MFSASHLPQIRKPFEKFEAKTPNVFYFNLGEDADYHGDDDQFDTLERHRRTIALPDELPSIIHEDGDEDEEEAVDEDTLSQPREEPASLEDLPSDQFDMPKRETSA